MKRMVLALVSVAALALPAVAVADGHDRGHGNSRAARACRHGGYRMLVGSDGTRFRNVGACVRYAARGGTLANLGRAGAGSSSEGFVIPAGAVATIAGAHWNLMPCDALSYGYQLGSGGLVTLASKPGGLCENGNLPGATIGPFSSTTLLRIFLADTGNPVAHVACDYTFYSTGSHALVSGSNPWRVDIRDSSGCSAGPNAPLAPATPGQGNLDLTVRITGGHAAYNRQAGSDRQGFDEDNEHGHQHRTSHTERDD